MPVPLKLTATKPERLADLGDDLPSQLRRRRRELGLLQVEAANQIGVCEFTLGNWERGDNQPIDRYYPAIIRYLGGKPWAEPTTLGEALLVERRLRGLTLSEAARVMGVDPSTLRHWEKGEWKPTKRTLGRLEAFVGIPVAERYPTDMR